MTEFLFEGYIIRTSREIYNGMWDVVWYPVDDATEVIERGGFFSGKDAIGYAKHSILDHMESLRQLEEKKYVSNVSD